MSSLCERLSNEGELLKFSDTEPIQALQAILEGRPEVIVLERLFAATPRGAALINRIRTDPNLGQSEVRVMSHTGDYMRQIARPAAAAPAGAGAIAEKGDGGWTRGSGGVGGSSIRDRRGTTATGLARHATRTAHPCQGRRRDSARWQSGRGGGCVNRRRPSHFEHDPAAESKGPRLDSPGGRTGALPRNYRVGEVRTTEALVPTGLPRGGRVPGRGRFRGRRILRPQ